MKDRKAPSNLSTHQLRQRLKTAGLSAGGGRKQLIQRYDAFVKETLAEAGLSSPSESEDTDGEEEAKENPTFVMVDGSTGNKFMRLVDQKGLGRKGDLAWLVREAHEELKAWGHPGGGDNAIVLKSDGERAIVALREAIAKRHGGSVTREQPPKGESQSNGIVEEAGKTIRDMARVLKAQLELRI